jgi:hypothetical protein
MKPIYTVSRFKDHDPLLISASDTKSEAMKDMIKVASKPGNKNIYVLGREEKVAYGVGLQSSGIVSQKKAAKSAPKASGKHERSGRRIGGVGSKGGVMGGAKGDEGLSIW